LAEVIAVDGSDGGVRWRATVVSTTIDTISWELHLAPPEPHRARFVATTTFGSGPYGDEFSSWPLGDHGPRWVIILLSADVGTMTLRHDGVPRSIPPVPIGTSRIPQLGILAVTGHPAQLDFHGDSGHHIGTLALIHPRRRRDGGLRDLTAPAPIGPIVSILGR
jgi:hypothetical protein